MSCDVVSQNPSKRGKEASLGRRQVRLELGIVRRRGLLVFTPGGRLKGRSRIPLKEILSSGNRGRCQVKRMSLGSA